jgi:predicted ATPase
LVGANGSGKSNFIRVLEMLGRIADGRLDLFVGRNGGAAALRHSGSTKPVLLRVDLPSLSYSAALESAPDDSLIFANEFVTVDGNDRILGQGHRESKLDRGYSPEVLETFKDCRVYHFHDTSVTAPVKQRVSVVDNIALGPDAGNLAAFLLRLQNEGRAYRRILGAVRFVAPFFDDFVLVPDTPDTLLLRWRQNGSDRIFSANQLSDGTLRFICLATLLLSPALPKVVVLDEPELGLHPAAIVQLAGMLRSASVRSQIVVATQSITLMNQFELADTIVVEREDGASLFARPDVENVTRMAGRLFSWRTVGKEPARRATTPRAFWLMSVDPVAPGMAASGRVVGAVRGLTGRGMAAS